MRFLFAFLRNRIRTGLRQLYMPTKEKECFRSVRAGLYIAK